MNLTLLFIAFTILALIYWPLASETSLSSANKRVRISSLVRLFAAFVVAATAGVVGYFYIIG